MTLLENYLNKLYEQGDYYPQAERLIKQSFVNYVGECRRKYNNPVTDKDKRMLRSCENKARRRALQKGRRYLENKRQSKCDGAPDPLECHKQTTQFILQLKEKIVAINKMIYLDDKALGRI